MDIVLAVVLFAGFLIVLDRSSSMTIANSVKVSKITGLGKTAIGFLLLASTTTLPELSVALLASLNGDAALSVGNVLGSNIVNICLIIGFATVLVTLRRSNKILDLSFAKEEFSNLYFGLFIASIIPLSLVYLAGANWIAGLILITIFIVYTYQLLKIRVPTEENSTLNEKMGRGLGFYIALTLLGAVGIIVSAYFLVDSAVAIAEFVAVPKTLIGATIVAFGTSLPEFTNTLKAFLKGHPALAFGNIIGSCFINITLILGITFLVPSLAGHPLTMNMMVFLDLVIFSLISNMLLWYFLSVGKMGRKEGAILLFIYVLFIATSLGAISLRVQPA